MALNPNGILVRLSLRRMNIDRWAVIYLFISACYPLLKPSVFPHPWFNAGVHGTLAAAIWFIAPWLRSQRHFLPRLLGEIYLPLLFPMFYTEMQYLGLIFFDFQNSLDPGLIRLEQWIFGYQPSLQWSVAWPWAWFHELMEFSYFSYYFLAIIFLVLAFRARGIPDDQRWDAVRDFVRDLSAVMLICYTLYTIFPAWGPKYFRAGPVDVGGWIFTDIMHNIHAKGAILGAAFPSSHVAASFIPWWHTWRWFPRHRWWMTLIFALLCMATVYCRYHYVVDVIAGMMLAILVVYAMGRLGDSARDRLRDGRCT